MKNYFQSRKNQLCFLLILIQLLIILNIIIPSYETIDYYEKKQEELGKKNGRLKRQLVYMKHHLIQKEETAKKLRLLEVTISKEENINQFNTQIERLSKEAGLNIIKQETASLEKTRIYNYRVITQELEGKYLSHINYLEKLKSLKKLISINSYSLKISDSSLNDPKLYGTIKIKLYRSNFK